MQTALPLLQMANSQVNSFGHENPPLFEGSAAGTVNWRKAQAGKYHLLKLTR
jgi:hypothetical protein